MDWSLIVDELHSSWFSYWEIWLFSGWQLILTRLVGRKKLQRVKKKGRNSLLLFTSEKLNCSWPWLRKNCCLFGPVLQSEFCLIFCFNVLYFIVIIINMIVAISPPCIFWSYQKLSTLSYQTMLKFSIFAP